MSEPSPSLGSVLVVGGGGFLGQRIVKQLIESGDSSHITVFDLKADGNRIIGPDYVAGNITSKEDVMAVLNQAKPKVIFHTASPKPLGNNKKLFEEVNINGTRNLVECAKEAGFTKAFIYTSSSSIIHDNYSDIVNATEDAPLCFVPEQKQYYSHTKAVAETIVMEANTPGGLLTCAIRPAGLFGEGDWQLYGNMAKNAKEGKAKMQIGKGNNLFDYTYISNHVDAQLLAANKLVLPNPPEGDMKVDGEAFVITNDDPWPFWDFARAVGAGAGYPVKKEQVWSIPLGVMNVFAGIAEVGTDIVTRGKGEATLTRSKIKYSVMTRTFNIEKAKKRLGYVPKVSMQEGLDRTAKWYVEAVKKDKK